MPPAFRLPFADQPAFRRVLSAEAVSNLGSMLSRLAIPWFATLSLNATPWQMGLVTGRRRCGRCRRRAVAGRLGRPAAGAPRDALRNVHDATWRQTATPPDRLARVDGSLRSIGHTVTLAGALGGGAAATVWGTRSALPASAVLLGLAALACGLWMARRPVERLSGAV